MTPSSSIGRCGRCSGLPASGSLGGHGQWSCLSGLFGINIVAFFANSVPTHAASSTLTPFGIASDGATVRVAELRNTRGMLVRISTRGAAILELDAPDRNGHMANVVLGKADFAAWEERGAPFNSIVGRYANRIAGGGFELDGHFFPLAGADPKTGIVSHGGREGFNQRLWQPILLQEPGAAGVNLHYVSPDGENGFPGSLDVSVSCELMEENVLRIVYHATTTKPTVLNLTNHVYFSLGAPGAGPIYGETLQVFASHFTPGDAHQVPTGEVRSVAKTPFDFRQPARLLERVYSDDPQVLLAHGLDHNFVLDEPSVGAPTLAVRLYDPDSGRVLEVRTTEPGVQIYTANFFNGSTVGSAGRALRQGDGIAFETQHFPNSPNQPNFPSTVLRPGEVFRSVTEFVFRTDARAHGQHRGTRAEGSQ
jgi:aldose 1-epimerase